MQYSTFMPGPVAPPQVPNSTYSASTTWGRGKETDQATPMGTVGTNNLGNLSSHPNQQQQQSFVNLPMSSRTQVIICFGFSKVYST